MPNISDFCESIGCQCASTPGPEGPQGPPGPMSPGSGRMERREITRSLTGVQGAAPLEVPFDFTITHSDPSAMAVSGGVCTSPHSTSAGWEPVVTVTTSQAARVNRPEEPDQDDPPHINGWRVKGSWLREGQDREGTIWYYAWFWIPIS